MRRRSLRVVVVGAALVVLALAFFLFFLSIASKSNNSAELMRTVGTVAGVLIGIGIAMAAAGSIGTKD
jgi:hypothetical protein